MKAFLTLILIVVFGTVAMAQEVPTNAKVESTQMALVLDSSINTTVLIKEAAQNSDFQIARLYKRKNTRVKKALSFTTKRNRSKLA